MARIEDLTQKATAGLSPAELARLGLPSAQQKVDAVLDAKAPAGLSLRELAQLGLASAQEKVQVVDYRV